MTALSFRLVCVPPTTSHHRKRIVRVAKWTRLADAPALLEAKQTLDDLLLPHQPAQPVAAPMVLSVEFTWPWLSRHGKRVRATGRQPCTGVVDCSNVIKTLEDRLVRLRFMADDKGVVELHVKKFWGDEPGILVVIAPYGTFPPLPAEQMPNGIPGGTRRPLLSLCDPVPVADPPVEV